MRVSLYMPPHSPRNVKTVEIFTLKFFRGISTLKFLTSSYLQLLLYLQTAATLQRPRQDVINNHLRNLFHYEKRLIFCIFPYEYLYHNQFFI